MSAGAVLATAGLAQAETRNAWEETQDRRADAYLSFAFGGGPRPAAQDSRLHYGLRFGQPWDIDAKGAAPYASLDFTPAGLQQLSFNGVPLLQRVQLPGAAAAGGEVEYLWSDWAMLAVAAAGFGFLIYEISDGDSDPDPEPADDDDGGLLGGDDGDDDDDGGLLGGLLGGDYRDEVYVRGLGERVDPEYQRWLDGGTGHMGDLGN